MFSSSFILIFLSELGGQGGKEGIAEHFPIQEEVAKQHRPVVGELLVDCAVKAAIPSRVKQS